MFILFALHSDKEMRYKDTKRSPKIRRNIRTTKTNKATQTIAVAAMQPADCRQSMGREDGGGHLDLDPKLRSGLEEVPNSSRHFGIGRDGHPDLLKFLR